MLAIAALVAFVSVERRAAEPVLPPRLFRNPVFRVTSAIGLVIGFALFGSLTYLPLFQQTVRGLSPTESGLQLIPLMVGLLAASIASGRVITRTGRYKALPDRRHRGRRDRAAAALAAGARHRHARGRRSTCSCSGSASAS